MDVIDLKTKLGSARSPVKRIKSKEERAAMQASQADLDPPARLRLCLTVGARPPAELITSQCISSAIQLDDCWKFARLLATPERAIDAAAVLRASQAMMQAQARPSVRRWARGLLSVAKLWQAGTTNPTVPTEATAIAFLSAVAPLMDYRVSQAEWGVGKSAPPRQLLTNLVSLCFELTELYPAIGSLILSAELLTKAVTRHSLDMDAFVPPSGMGTRPTDTLWKRMAGELKSAVAAIRLGDVRELLRVLSSYPGKTREFRELVGEALATEGIDLACRQLLVGYIELGTQEDSALAFAPGLHEDVETTELARVLMKAWDVSTLLAPAEELADEVITTLGRLFGLRLIGDAEQAIPYSPQLHEFELGATVADLVRVVRPGVQKVAANISVVVFKAVVRAAKEHPNVQ